MWRMKWFRWFAPGLRIKRWLFLFAIGVILLVAGAALMMNYQWLAFLEDEFLEFIYEQTGSYNYTMIASIGLIVIFLGAICMLWGAKKVIKTIITAILPQGEGQLGDYIFQNMRLGQGPKVVVIGGGTGLSTLLRGLKNRTANLTAIVTVADDGGSSGRLREDYDIIAPGDLRNCLVALAEKEGLMEELFQYRFSGTGNLAGHSFGNLFLTALTQMLDQDVEKALEAASKILKVRGRVIPSSTEKVKLGAEMEDGSRIMGESHIPESGKKIKRVFTEPKAPKAEGTALQAIDEADAIILGPGSLYTSIMPNLLVDKIAEHIKASKAMKLYICNVMTQPGETDGYTAADHVQAIIDHAGEGLVNMILVNDSSLSEETVEAYRKASAEPVFVDTERLTQMGVRTVRAMVADESGKAAHNPQRLGKVVMDMIYALQTDIEPHILEYYLNRKDH